MDRASFIKVLEENQGVVVVKYGATWCGPCKKIEGFLESKRCELPKNVGYYALDVDDDFDLYALFKSKKQVRGVPVVLAFKQGNVTPYSDACVTGTSPDELKHFFSTVHGWAAQAERLKSVHHNLSNSLS